MSDHCAATVVTAPTIEPVTVPELREHMRLDDQTEDDYVAGLIRVAREFVENATNRALLTQTWDLFWDCFPSGARTIRIRRAPMASVTSVKYVDTGGTEQTWDASNYAVDSDSEPGRITPAWSVTWPNTRDVDNAVTIRVVLGWTSADLVPWALRHAVKLLAAHLFENREATSIVALQNIPLGIQNLIWPQKVVSFA